MKKKRVTALLLAAMLTSLGCGRQSQELIRENLTENMDSSTEDAAKDAGNDTTNDTTLEKTASKSASIDYSDIFSNRDFEVGYDADKSAHIKLNGSSASCDSSAVQISKNIITIKEEGTYILSGTLDDGMVIVDTDKKDKVQLVLDNVTINSKTSAPIYVLQSDKVFLTMAPDSVNTLSNGGEFTAIDENNIDAVIYSKEDLTLNGSGKLTVTSPGGHGIVSKDSLRITSGSYEINSASHGLSGKDDVCIANADLTIESGGDGIHAQNKDDASLGFAYIQSGTFHIKASGDGISASASLMIEDGSFDVTSGGGSKNAVKKTSDSRGGFPGGRRPGGRNGDLSDGAPSDRMPFDKNSSGKMPSDDENSLGQMPSGRDSSNDEASLDQLPPGKGSSDETMFDSGITDIHFCPADINNKKFNEDINNTSVKNENMKDESINDKDEKEDINKIMEENSVNFEEDLITDEKSTANSDANLDEKSDSKSDTNTGADTDEEESESTKGIKAETQLTIHDGSFTIDSADDAIHSNTAVIIEGGSFEIASGDDAFHADESLKIADGSIQIKESYEGIEALHIEISGGEITLTASDDGLNAAGGKDSGGVEDGKDPNGVTGGKDSNGVTGNKGGGFGHGMSSSSDGSITITGGKLDITANGDGIDANGSVEITGGDIVVCCPAQGDTSVLDYDTEAKITGGSFIGTGASGMAQSFSGAKQGVIAINVGNQSEGTKIKVTDSDGNAVVTHKPDLSYDYVLISGPDIVSGETYKVTVGSASKTVNAS